MLKNTVLTSIKILFAGALLYWMIQKGLLDLRILAHLAQPEYLIISAGLMLLMLINNNYRWTILLRSQGFDIGFRQTMPLSFIGLFFNYAMPGGVGGDIVKAYYLLQDYPDKKMVAATTILMDRITGIFGMAMMASIALLIDIQHVLQHRELIQLALLVWTLWLSMIVFFIIAFYPPQWAILQPFLRKSEGLPGYSFVKSLFWTVHSYKKELEKFYYSLLLGLTAQFLNVGLIWFLVSRTSEDVFPANVFFVGVPVGLIITVVPISPAGVGIGQAAFYFLFKLYSGIASDAGPNAVTTMQVLLLSWGLIGVYYYIMRSKKSGLISPQQLNEQETSDESAPP